MTVEVAFTGRRSADSSGSATRKQKPKQQPPKKGTCRACGRKGHWAKDSECAARNQKCFKCHAVGHFSKYCPSPGKSFASVDAVQILSVTPEVQHVERQPSPYYDAVIDCQRVPLLVDTGSAVSILPGTMYKQRFGHIPLRPAGRLTQWNGSDFRVFGKITVAVTCDSQSIVSADFYVADGRVSIMGRDLQKLLSVTVSCGSTISLVEDQVLFNDQVLPATKGFVQKVRLLPEAVPVTTRLRTLPYAVRQEVSDHLMQLESQGVIERVSCGSSPWLSPIVAVKKRGGQGLYLYQPLKVSWQSFSRCSYDEHSNFLQGEVTCDVT